MPPLPQVRSTIDQFARKTNPLVVVIAGGTTGIGSYIAQAFASTFRDAGHKLRVYIVGRNAQRAEDVISKARQTCPGSEWQFVKVANLAEMSDVDQACEELRRLEEEKPFGESGVPRIDLLYVTYSVSVLAKRSTTSTGADSLMSTLYYTRLRFITQLLPLLTASPLAGHAISVYSGNMEHHTDLPRPSGQLPIGAPSDKNYGVTSVRKHVSFMKTFAFEHLAQQHAGKLRLTHIFPGLVDGPGMDSAENPIWFRLLWKLMRPVVSRIYMTSQDDCGAVMVFLATQRFAAKGAQVDGEVARGTDGVVGSGAYACGARGDVGVKGKPLAYSQVRSQDTADKVWEHTSNVVGRVG